MYQHIKFTLYEISGYILPGIILLLAIAILFWAIYLPSWPISSFNLSWSIWVFIILFSYFSGHIVQAIGNLLIKLYPLNEEIILGDEQKSIPETILNVTKSKVSELYNIDVKDVGGKWLYHICDETVAQHGDTRDREVFIYREGFYRGLTIAFAVLTISLLVRGFIPGAAIELSTNTLNISSSMMGFFIIISLTSAILTFNRYRRFAHYRIAQALIGFLAINADIREGGKKNA